MNLFNTSRVRNKSIITHYVNNKMVLLSFDLEMMTLSILSTAHIPVYYNVLMHISKRP